MPLREDTQAWWAATLGRDPDELGDGEEPATPDVEGLRRFLEGEVLPWFENRKKELANRPLIREQAFGEALDPDKLSGLDATRCISTASSNECSPCCCGSRSCDELPSRTDPFGKSQAGCAGPCWPYDVLAPCSLAYRRRMWLLGANRENVKIDGERRCS
jgi:hypothetical protein